jgi:hypothetical protein
MTRLSPLLAALVLAAGAAQADSGASSASSASSQSVGSLSNSIATSSNSSSPDEKKAEGEYRILDLAQAPAKPGMVRLHLAPLAAGAPAFFLDLPAATAEKQALAVGDVVDVRQRAYGLEFARATTREAFYLVLADEWFRELESRPL